MLTCVIFQAEHTLRGIEMTEWDDQAKQRFGVLVRDKVWNSASDGGKVSKEKLGSMLGVRGQTINDWINGAIPDTPRLAKIASMIGWSLDDIFFYLQTGQEPGNIGEEKMIYMFQNMPIYKVEKIINQALRRIVSEATSSYGQ